MDFLIEKVIDAVLDASGINDQVSRNEHIIRLLQRLGLDDIESLTKFEDIYSYAVVEYAYDEAGQCKPKLLVEFFKAKEIRDLFYVVYSQNDPQGWLRKGEDIAQYRLGKQLPTLDPRRELAIFAGVFMELVRQTRSIKEIRAEQKQQTRFDRLQRQLQDIQIQIQRLPSLEAINQKVNQLAGTEILALPATAQISNAVGLARQLGEWFEVLDYDRDLTYEIWTEDYFEWIINFPLTRRKTSRILVRGVAGEVGMDDLQEFHQKVEKTGADEGWLVGNRRVSKAARTAVQQQTIYENISCYTFDELLDEDADFSKYLEWLEADIKTRKVDTDYLPLGCRKDELDPVSQRKIGVSVYGEEDGWIDGYVDQWLDDPAKEHLSILGEFGTGKTWFALHYAWVALQRYQDAKKRGLDRPRVPIVVPLREYAKAVTVESLFSEFFFRKHEILKSYSVFDRLNRMGKLLLIFDGFDEMAARVNRQAMIDNFWELAKIVVPGAKAILTCRTEHFPDAIEGRRLLNAELKASTALQTGEPPQFEVLELEKFNDEQIAQILGHQAQEGTIQKVMKNPQLLDLARRPVMVDLILEALPEIEAGKPVDMSRVYLYAVVQKMENDISSKRTFTSLADKLYFLCELSWEMLSTDRMSLNYRAFPERLQQMFGERVQEEKELDHWRYDMMGQTMLIRNSEGDYSPAHRSLLEFFVAYKIVASLGAMAEDFIKVARQQSGLDKTSIYQEYTWETYFKRGCNSSGIADMTAPLSRFTTQSTEVLLSLLSRSKLAKAVLDLAHPMLDSATMRERLFPLLWTTKKRTMKEVGYLGGNIVQLMLAQTPHALSGSNLNQAKLRGVDFTKTYLHRINLQGASLLETIFSEAIGTVNSVAFSPKGEHIAIGDSKGTVQVWHVASGQVELLCSDHTGSVQTVVFSPDGTQLASGSSDKTVKLWTVASGVCVRTLSGHEEWIRSVAFSPDGTQLVSGSADNTIKLWTVATGECVRTLSGHEGWIVSVAFSPDGTHFASGSSDNTVKLWTVAAGECVRTLSGHEDWVRSVTFSPDGTYLASGSSDNTVKLWTVTSGECVQTLSGHENLVVSAAFSPDSTQLVSGSADKTVKLWTVPSGVCVRTLSGHEDWVRSVAFSPDGTQLISGSADKTVKLWTAVSGECVRTLSGHENLVVSVAFSPDGTQLASGSYDYTVKLWTVTSGECVQTLSGHENLVMSVAFSPDGTYLASGSSDNTVKLWALDSGKCVQTLSGHEDWVRSVAFSPDGTHLASGSDDKTMKLWALDSGKCVQTLSGHKDWVRSVAFSPDGTQLVSGSADTTVKLWTVASGECSNTLFEHKNLVVSVAFSPDGTQLVSGSADTTVKLWTVTSGECVRTLSEHEDWVRSVAFSSDGTQLVSASSDNTVKLWATVSGKCIYTLSGHENRVRSVAFSPDGTRLASAGDDETIRLWDLKTGKCLQVIDERVCAGLNITDVVGITDAQRTALKLMGAIEHNGK